MANKNLTPVVSSNIAAIGYFGDRLVVEFADGDLYAYENVPKGIFDSMLASKSKGAFLNAEVKTAYQFQRILSSDVDAWAKVFRQTTSSEKKTAKNGKKLSFAEMVMLNPNFAYFF